MTGHSHHAEPIQTQTKFPTRNFLIRRNTITTTNIDRNIAEIIIPTTATLATAYIEWARDKEYDALRAYYLVGVALYNGTVKAKELEKSYGKSFLSKLRKVAKTVDTSKEFAKLYTNGNITSISDAYEMTADYVGKVSTSRVVWLEDLEKKEAELLAKLAEVQKAKKTAKRKPAKVAK